MIRFPAALAAAATIGLALLGAMAFPAQARAPRIISQTAQGQPILLASVTVTATALRD